MIFMHMSLKIFLQLLVSHNKDGFCMSHHYALDSLLSIVVPKITTSSYPI